MEHKPNPGHELLPGLTGRAKWAVNTSTTTLIEGKGRRGRGAPGGDAVGRVSENRQGGQSAVVAGLTLKLPEIRCISPERS